MKKHLFIVLFVITANAVQAQNHFNGIWIEASGDIKKRLNIYTTSNGQFIDVNDYGYDYTEKIIDPWFGESYINKLLTTGGKRRKVYIVQIDNKNIMFDNTKFRRIN